MKTRAIAFFARCLAGTVLALLASLAPAAVGVTEIPGKDGDRVVTVFYPSSGQEAQVKRGPFAIQLAENGVPFAADFDTASLAAPKIPLGFVTAQKDVWLIPRFHSDPVLKACAKCERVADFPAGGHGALLSPPPPKLEGLVGDLLNDPPGFDRAKEVPEVNRRIVAFFSKHLGN